MGQLGAKLKRARLDQGFSLEELQQRTKIQKHYLEGIEAGNYSAIPGAFYVRAFIKRYAQAVGLNGDALLAEHESELPEEQATAPPADHFARRSEPKKRSSGPMPEAMPKILVALFIVFILLVIWYFYLLSTSGNGVEPADEGGGGVEYEAPAEQEREEQPDSAPEDAPEEEQAAEPEEAPKEASAELALEGVSGETTTYLFTGPTDKQLDFTATGDSWVSVISDDGAELLSLARVFGAGETETLDVSDETSVFMRIGDYAMLTIELNGEQVPYEQERKPQNIIIRFDDAE
ncbi:helix-turn-helix domain-containing protein [Planococcus sp. ISL-109]|nr:helix-turn-helix domain-containing protein [Planococcus sp. ISL-109]